MMRSLLTITTAIALGAPIRTAPPSINEFRPSAHGFAFANSFKGSPLPGALGVFGGALGAAAGAPSSFGLCGGMSFVAADFYLAGRAIPATSTVPARGHPLYDYIYARQVDSLGPNIELAAKFSRWMDVPDQGPVSAGAFTLGALPPMLDQLGRGEPVVLGLVLTDSSRSREPWHNHQVLACEAAMEAESPRGITRCTFRIYDPNYPRADGASVRIDLRAFGLVRIGHDLSPVLGAQAIREVPGFRATRIRGVFDMPYEPRTPPDGL
ncbi:MAG: hypothetical protein KF869_11545 [Phycisphaeraceae bacterium]|nr:hypothetical protein [Phycisphaeraceae bacterium]